MLNSEAMRAMLNHTKQLQSQFVSGDSKESQATKNYNDAHNAFIEEQIHRQELAELSEATDASSDDGFFVNINSEVKTK